MSTLRLHEDQGFHAMLLEKETKRKFVRVLAIEQEGHNQQLSFSEIMGLGFRV
jgi:hypothetical protein